MALRGLNVVEFAGLAPGPMCGMILADFGAKVVRVDRIGALGLEQDSLSRGKYSLAVDLKKPEGHGIVRKVLQTETKYKMWRPPNTKITGTSTVPPPYSLNRWGYRANFWAERT